MSRAVANRSALELIQGHDDRGAGYPSPSTPVGPGYHAPPNPIPGYPPGWTAHVHGVEYDPDADEYSYRLPPTAAERAELITALTHDPEIQPGPDLAAAINSITNPQAIRAILRT
jgi:hypothetical protein